MPNTGAPASIWFPDDTMPVSPLEGLFSQLAVSVNLAFTLYGTPIYDTKANLDLNPGTTVGQSAIVTSDPTIAYRRIWYWNGSQWATSVNGATPFAEAAGTGSNANSAFGAVTFPTGRFTVAPLVFIQVQGSAPLAPLFRNVTASGFEGGGFNTAGSAVASSWNWRAVQMTPTAAAG